LVREPRETATQLVKELVFELVFGNRKRREETVETERLSPFVLQ
jgi:hypothetical protein